jgi:hypothetical protein
MIARSEFVGGLPAGASLARRYGHALSGIFLPNLDGAPGLATEGVIILVVPA